MVPLEDYEAYATQVHLSEDGMNGESETCLRGLHAKLAGNQAPAAGMTNLLEEIITAGIFNRETAAELTQRLRAENRFLLRMTSSGFLDPNRTPAGLVYARGRGRTEHGHYRQVQFTTWLNDDFHKSSQRDRSVRWREELISLSLGHIGVGLNTTINEADISGFLVIQQPYPHAARTDILKIKEARFPAELSGTLLSATVKHYTALQPA